MQEQISYSLQQQFVMCFILALYMLINSKTYVDPKFSKNDSAEAILT